jgi:lysyl-tRNA synthetase class 2
MLEFYMAYADVNQMMDFAEKLLRSVVQVATGGLVIKFRVRPELLMNVRDPREKEVEIDFSKPFKRLRMSQAIAEAVASRVEGKIDDDLETWLRQGPNARILSEFLWWIDNDLENETKRFNPETDELLWEMPDNEIQILLDQKWQFFVREHENDKIDDSQHAKEIVSLFEDFAEDDLVQPTFITDFPKPVSPLSKASPTNPTIAERFEYFVGGLESGNGFSELNDPEEQYQRFKDQVGQRERGDEEAMVMDEDYIRALSYGMPPAAGIGLGIDRLVMLLANKQSIRDVIMFPHMRPERRADDEGNAEQ